MERTLKSLLNMKNKYATKIAYLNYVHQNLVRLS